MSRFQVLRSRTHFRRYRGHQVPFSSFPLSDSFSMLPRASAPVFMFCALGLLFGDTEGVGSRFQVLRVRTHFWLYRGRPVLFSCFALPNMFSTVPRALGTIFMFCAPGLIFGGTDDVRSRLHVLRARTRFRPYRGCQVLFAYFALTESFPAVPRASCPVCAPGLIFGGTEGVGSRF
jgi:hypothetical protein